MSYGALKRRFNLDDDYLQDLKDELIGAQRLAVDEDGKILVWAGTAPVSSSEFQVSSSSQPLIPSTQPPSAERRQLTVMFCDLVGSTALSTRLDPEDLREVVQQYQQTCAEVIQRHEGYLAQYLGDGLLVYFGYPTAHEDDARRAVRTGLEIVDALRHKVPSPRQGEGQGEVPLQVRIGIHTGLVVIGEIGSSEKRELLALGETPNLAARIQGLAEPNTVLIGAVTQRLIDGSFECQPFGSHLVKGIDTPIAVYHVQSERQGTSPLAGRGMLTPLVGREQEVGLLIDRWEQAKEGRGQVVLLSGEPGIGKSRLTHTLREHVTSEGSLLFEARCSPYHQHSAFYPLIDVLQRTLLLMQQDTDSEKVGKLERALALYNMQETLPLFVSLLSLPAPRFSLPAFSPQKQKERTLQAMVQLLVTQAERQATVSVWEDLHWADPSSLEFLSLLIEQLPTSKLLLVLTFRPEFTPPWKPRSHISQLVLNRLGKKQVEAMIAKVTADTALSAEVIEQIRLKTDGVPLFVEEITKSVIESVGGQGSGVRGRDGKSGAVLGIPATLQEALLARLDRLSSARPIAQLGATLGREFAYELLAAVAPVSEPDLQAALTKLVEAEILYQRGIGEQVRYFFKHALIQDTAYQSLLKSTRQQYHQQIAQMLEERFPQTKETHPELLAHHYTEAGLVEQAISYWQRAGERDNQRSAYMEAISHLTKELELLKTFPDTIERVQQELTVQLALNDALVAIKGFAALEVEKTALRIWELCQQSGETPQLSRALPVLWSVRNAQAEYETARMLAEQFLSLIQRVENSSLRTEAYYMLGATLYFSGKLSLAHDYLAQGIAFYNPQKDNSCISGFSQNFKVSCLSYDALALWPLGYPDQALKRIQEALSLAQELSHPFSLAFALTLAAWMHLLRREEQLARERAEAVISLSTEQGFSFWLALGTIVQGWTLAEQEQAEEGISQIRQGLSACRAAGAEIGQTHFLTRLAEVYGKMGQAGEGLKTLAEALDRVQITGERSHEAELYRLKGELTLQKLSVISSQLSVTDPRPVTPDPQSEAEACFLKAIDIAQKQQAKSWELRAATSLARLWQQQALEQGAKSTEQGARSTQHETRTRLVEAHKLLSDVYNWFTEGFDTKDLQEAKGLLADLAT